MGGLSKMIPRHDGCHHYLTSHGPRGCEVPGCNCKMKRKYGRPLPDISRRILEADEKETRLE